MSDPHSSEPDATSSQRDRELAGTPRWVKVFWVIGAVVLLVIIVLLLAGGEHGPGRHF